MLRNSAREWKKGDKTRRGLGGLQGACSLGQRPVPVILSKHWNCIEKDCKSMQIDCIMSILHEITTPSSDSSPPSDPEITTPPNDTSPPSDSSPPSDFQPSGCLTIECTLAFDIQPGEFHPNSS